MMLAENVVYRPPDRGLFHTSEPILGPYDENLGVYKILHGGMWAGQKKWWELPNFIRMLVGGYGAGKTLQLGKRMLTAALINGTEMRRVGDGGKRWWRNYEPIGTPPPVAIVSPTYSVARETTVATIESLLINLELWYSYWRSQPDIEPRWIGHEIKRTAPYIIKIWYKRGRYRPRMGRIIIYSGENADKLKGPNIAAVGIDEPFIQDLEVFEQMIARCRHPKAKLREVNLTGTPESLNWGYDLAEGDLKERYDVGVVQTSTVENKSLPSDYVKRLLGAYDDRVASAYVHGNFVNLVTGLVYYGFNRFENVVELPMPEGAELGVGMDFNVNPMAAAVFWVVRKGKNRHMHFIDELELPNCDTVEMCRILKKTYNEVGPTIPVCGERDDIITIHAPLNTVYPDSQAGRATNAPGGRTDYDIIRDMGFLVHKRAGGNPLRKDRYNTVNGMLREHDGRIRMTISPRCKKLIKYQMVYSHEMMNAQENMSHLLDARDYPVCILFPADRAGLKLQPIHGV